MATYDDPYRRPARGPLESALAGALIHTCFWLAIIALHATFMPALKKEFDDYGLAMPWRAGMVLRGVLMMHEYPLVVVGVLAALMVLDAVVLYRLGRLTSSRVLRELWSGLVVAVPVAVLVVMALSAVLPYQKLTTMLMNEHQQLLQAQQAELKALDGTWTLAGRERDGQALPGEQLPKETLVIQGGKYSWRTDQGEEKGAVEVQPFRRPGTVVLTADGGPGHGPVTGVYVLEGDKLTVCLPPADGTEPPPTALTTAGNKCTLSTFERAKE
jgi:uncharacterized protein (TIGR03067 family)